MAKKDETPEGTAAATPAKRTRKPRPALTGPVVAASVRKQVSAYVMHIGVDHDDAAPIIVALKSLVSALTGNA